MSQILRALYCSRWSPVLRPFKVGTGTKLSTNQGEGDSPSPDLVRYNPQPRVLRRRRFQNTHHGGREYKPRGRTLGRLGEELHYVFTIQLRVEFVLLHDPQLGVFVQVLRQSVRRVALLSRQHSFHGFRNRRQGQVV